MSNDYYGNNFLEPGYDGPYRAGRLDEYPEHDVVENDYPMNNVMDDVSQMNETIYDDSLKALQGAGASNQMMNYLAGVLKKENKKVLDQSKKKIKGNYKGRVKKPLTEEEIENQTPFCGIGEPRRNQRIGTMNECAESKQVRLYGLRKVDRRLANNVSKGPKMPPRKKVLEERGKYLGKINRLSKIIKHSKNQKEIANAKKEGNLYIKEFKKWDALLQKMNAKKK